MVAEYARAYRDCSRWLAQVLPPWGWLLGTLDACQELRASVPVE